jgi:hypothetical protein
LRATLLGLVIGTVLRSGRWGCSLGDAKKQKWNLVNEQFALLVPVERVRTDEVLLDVEFRRRLAELIDQALKRKRGSGH